MGATASLDRVELTIDPGDTITSTLRVRNNGHVVDQFTFEAVGPCASWIDVEPPTISILPNAEETVTVRFAPPRSSEVKPGPAPYGLKVVSREDPQGSVAEEGTVVVGRFDQRSLELNPLAARCRRRATFEVAVDNRGNAPIELSLSASDGEDACRYRFKEPVVEVGPGAARFTKLEVAPARTFWKGAPKSHQFQVVATSEDQEPQVLDATLLQEALLPRWIVKAALVTVALILALFIVWHTWLKGTVESVAREAVEAPIDVLEDRVDEIAPTTSAADATSPTTVPEAGGASPAGDGSSTSPTTVPDGSSDASVAAEHLTPFGDPADVQLGTGATAPAGGSVSTQHVFESDFALTDVILQNPGGDAGTVTIARDGVVLLNAALENFRDYDVHFVAPYMFTKGQTLSLNVSCTTPGPQNTSGCAVSASFAGFAK